MATAKKQKRKRLVLSIEEKVEVVAMLDKDISYTVIMERFGIGKSTVGDIWKNKEKILAFRREMVEMGMSRKAKTMKQGDQKLDQAAYLWFKQKRMEGVPIIGPMLCQKAVELSKRLYGEKPVALLQVEGGDGGSARGMESVSFLLRVRNSRGTRNRLINLYLHFKNLLKRKTLLSTKYLTVMRQGSIFGSYQILHLLQVLKSQPLVEKNLRNV